MRAILTDESAQVYASTEDQTVSIATVHQDEEFEIGKVIHKKRQNWVEVTLDSGVKGYLSGDVHLFGLKNVILQDASAELRASADASSEVLKTLKKGDAFYTLGVVKTEEGGWVRVRDASGTEGYIEGKTKIRVLPAATRAEAKKTLILVGVMTLAGIAFALVSALAPQASIIYYYLAVGFILFGFMQLVQGFVQRRQALKQERQDLEQKKPGEST
jgi:uncharacterized protein YgiM (DUF1202 family)